MCSIMYCSVVLDVVCNICCRGVIQRKKIQKTRYDVPSKKSPTIGVECAMMIGGPRSCFYSSSPSLCSSRYTWEEQTKVGTFNQSWNDIVFQNRRDSMSTFDESKAIYVHSYDIPMIHPTYEQMMIFAECRWYVVSLVDKYRHVIQTRPRG